jgi:hypothetical protein
MSFRWNSWIGDVWDSLVDGRKLVAPTWLPHPADAGFTKETLATDAGQIADWVLSLEDESRLHVHEFSDGRLVAHRDRIDPNRSPLHAVAHFAWETDIGRIALLIGSIALGTRLLDQGGAR